MREAPQQACEGQDPRLFWSTHPDDHAAARRFCLGTQNTAPCPAIEACTRFRDQCLADPQYGLGVEGTWAGVLYRDGRPFNPSRKGVRRPPVIAQ